MAITIQTYSVSNDLSSISLDFKMSGQNDTVNNVLMWTEKTYKDPNNSIDLTAFMSGLTNEESVVINASELELSSFDGIYFIEITSAEGDAVAAGAADFTQYYKAAATLLSRLDMSCLACNSDFQNALLLDLYLQATINSLLLGRYQDAIEHLSKIHVVTESYEECKECFKVKPSVSTSDNIVSVGIIDCQLSTS